jgi:hypothetical protein
MLAAIANTAGAVNASFANRSMYGLGDDEASAAEDDGGTFN